MALISSIGLYYLLDCDYLLQYEVGITVFYYFFHMESHMSLSSAIAIGAFQWISQVILTKLLSNIINLNQVEIITCKNVFLLLLHKFFKRCIYALSVVSFFATGKHGHFVWLAFDTDQRFFDFKINFLFEVVSSSSRLLIVSMVIHVLYGDSPLIQNKEY